MHDDFHSIWINLAKSMINDGLEKVNHNEFDSIQRMTAY
jgi:hypothetical protein